MVRTINDIAVLKIYWKKEKSAILARDVSLSKMKLKFPLYTLHSFFLSKL